MVYVETLAQLISLFCVLRAQLSKWYSAHHPAEKAKGQAQRAHALSLSFRGAVGLPIRMNLVCSNGLLNRLSVGRARPIVCSEVGVLSTNSRSGTGTRALLGQRRHRQFSSWWFQRTSELRTCEGCRTPFLAWKQGLPF